MADQQNGAWRTRQGEGRYEHDFERDDYDRGRSSGWQGGSDWDEAEWNNPYDRYGSGEYARDIERRGQGSPEWDRDYGRGRSGWNQGYGQDRWGSSEWDRRYGQGSSEWNSPSDRYSRGGQRRYGQSNAEWDRDYGQYGYSRSDLDRSYDRYGSGNYSRDIEQRGRGSTRWNRDYRRGSYDQDRNYRGDSSERNYGSYGRGDYNMMGTSGGGRYSQRRSDWDRDYGRNRGRGPERYQEARPGGYDYDWEGDYSQHFEDFGTTAGLQHRQAPDQSFSEFWSAPGPYYGRGPKGYQRSNERIQEDVCERMTHHGHLNAEDIELEVNNGQVILKGTVDSRQAKRLAEDIAESVSGVSQVMNQLQIKQEQQREAANNWSTEETKQQGPSA